MAVKDCVIGLGANLGDRRASFEGALRELGVIGELSALSHLYETKPVGGPPQPNFLNAAVRLHTPLNPRLLLDHLLQIESHLGRVRTVRWGPRTLDLDLLWIDGISIDEPHLSVPHPRLVERPFALRPLLDVAPSAIDPVSGVAYREFARSRGAFALHPVQLASGLGWSNRTACSEPEHLSTVSLNS